VIISHEYEATSFFSPIIFPYTVTQSTITALIITMLARGPDGAEISNQISDHLGIWTLYVTHYTIKYPLGRKPQNLLMSVCLKHLSSSFVVVVAAAAAAAVSSGVPCRWRQRKSRTEHERGEHFCCHRRQSGHRREAKCWIGWSNPPSERTDFERTHEGEDVLLGSRPSLFSRTTLN